MELGDGGGPNVYQVDMINCLFDKQAGGDTAIVPGDTEANTPTMTHCTIAHEGGGNSVIGWLKGGTLTMTNCIASWKIWDDAGLDGRIATRNCLVADIFDGTIDLGGNLQENPVQFVDAANYDYHLMATSLAVDSGANDTGVTDDLEGTARTGGPCGARRDAGTPDHPVQGRSRRLCR